MAKGRYEQWMDKEGLLKLEAWARNGLTDEQIAHNIGINVATLYTWKNKHSQICEALKRGKEVVDIQVENALLKRALGYSYTEKKVKREGGVITEEVTTVRDVPPDVTAQIFWLKNRKPGEWRDRQRIEVSATLDTEKSKLDNLISQLRGN